MKTLTLQNLRLKNFKGCTAFTLSPGGMDISVFGRNETGKSTILDGFNWLIFGKDSQGKADFTIKPQDQDGNDIHNLDTEVEATLEINGKSVTLMRRYKEVYTKKRGQARQEFTGHTTDYFIDEVPAKKKEYDTKIADIIDANSFKLVTNPYEFNLLHWTGRRQTLLEICGDVSDSDVLDSLFPSVDKKTEHGILANIINSGTIDDEKKKIAAKKKLINDELSQIPVRIDELEVSIQDATAPDPKNIKVLEKKLADEHENLRQIRSNEKLAAKQAELSEVDAQISQATGKAQDQASEKKGPINQAIDKLTAERREVSTKAQALRDDIARDEKQHRITGDALGSLREHWKKIKADAPNIKTDCPTCGQVLPEDQIEATRERFNQDKAQRLERNMAEGKTLRETFDSLESTISRAKAKVDDLSARLPVIDDQIKAKQGELKAVYVPVNVDALDQKKDVLEREISALRNGSITREGDCKDRIAEYKKAIAELQTQQAAYDAAKKTRARIEGLGAQEKQLAAEYENQERILNLIEKFIKYKCSMVEDSINDRFSLAEFKLFKDQINGGVEECCETLGPDKNGKLVVPYNSGLNSAARINVGLDIIRTLSEYYGFRAPIFIDNAESINEIIPMDAQVITFSVSDNEELVVVETEVREAS